MKNKNLFEKIKSLCLKKSNGESSLSTLSKRFKQQPCYRAKHLGAQARKKSLREKWQAKKGSNRQKSISPVCKIKGKQSRRPLRPAVLLGVFLICGYLLVTGPLKILYGNWNYFRINEIEISGCLMTTPNTLRKFADISYEMNMLTLDPEAIEGRLLSHPWIAKAEIRRIWPDRLAVTIREYRPNALIVQAEEEGFNYLDRKGKIFAAVTSGQDLDFPVITGLDAFNTREEKERLLKEATSFLQLAERNNPNLPAQNISEIHFNRDGELILYLVEQPFPIYFGKGDIKRKYYQLRKVLEVLYRKRQGKSIIGNVAYIRMDYQDDKVLVIRSSTG
ncbi:MAG TPA: FtsQ-type POTRA domain-containing protein [Desulfocapsa sulfexigens]|nr:FtsQ-type POTRA domain-containing protein [Desulfocapsa sulfexigens]